MALYQFPGTDFHDLNLDWLLSEMKKCLAEWASTQEDWETLRTDNAAFVARITAEWAEVRSYIDNYFDNLDVSTQISNKIDAMAADGSLLALISSTVANSAGAAATTWINEHLAQETGYVIDTSLTVAGAAADAKAAGDMIRANHDLLTAGVMYSTQDAADFPFPRMGFSIASTGYYSINQTNYVISGIQENTVKMYAGSTFRAKPGYQLRYVYWEVPVYSATSGLTPASAKIYGPSAFISYNTLITVPQDCYVMIAARREDQLAFDSDDAVTNFNAAVELNVIYTTVKDIKMDKAVDPVYQDQVMMVDSTGAIVPSRHFDRVRAIDSRTNLFRAQKAIANDWHFPFINMSNAMGLGSNHRIPGTAALWSDTNTTALTQREIWMRDGTHPYRGVGLVDMYGRTIAKQFDMVAPSYHDSGDSSTDWAGKHILWMGTSIPAGSDPEAGSGTGATYPQIVASYLGATVHNISKGSSMVRINASGGNYAGIPFTHFCRALTRTHAENRLLQQNWNDIRSQIANAPSTLTSEHLQIMDNTSFETLLLPWLDGTNAMPDVFVIDHGHNDTALGEDGQNDFWITPTIYNQNRNLAADQYMADSNYTNLKTVMHNLDGISSSNIAEFAASVNRNSFQGAMNFLITLILTYNPYARIIVISDYD